MKNKLPTLAVVLLAFFTLLNFSFSSQALQQTKNLETLIKENPNKIVYVQAKDGYTPVKGKDYFDGTAGINAMSYVIQTNTIEQLPIIGPIGPAGKDGKDGVDGAFQQTQINPDTKDIETKMSYSRYWETLVHCSEYRLECPDAN